MTTRQQLIAEIVKKFDNEQTLTVVAKNILPKDNKALKAYTYERLMSKLSADNRIALSKLSVREVMDACKTFNLEVQGTKDDMLQRIHLEISCYEIKCVNSYNHNKVVEEIRQAEYQETIAGKLARLIDSDNTESSLLKSMISFSGSH